MSSLGETTPFEVKCELINEINEICDFCNIKPKEININMSIKELKDTLNELREYIKPKIKIISN